MSDDAQQVAEQEALERLKRERAEQEEREQAEREEAERLAARDAETNKHFYREERGDDEAVPEEQAIS